MGEGHTLEVIARIHSDCTEKFGIPRQSGLVDSLRATLVFEPAYRREEAVRGLEEFSHIWLLWQFSRNAGAPWSPLVRPPRLGGNRKMGVFATRSPFRPNPLGLSAVRLLEIQRGPVLVLGGADLLDGTPVYDIKPYLPYADSIPAATGGFTGRTPRAMLAVDIPEPLLGRVPPEKREALRGLLAQDPRPAYQDDPARIYGMAFAGLEVRFTVAEGRAIVHEITSGGGKRPT